MTKEAEKLGLTPTAEDREVFSVLTETDAFIEARYYHHRNENVRDVRGAQSDMRQSPGRRRPHPTEKRCDDSTVTD
jgi:hypothetical protein